MSSIFHLTFDKEGRVTADQTVTDREGKPSTLKGEAARIDQEAWENIGTIATTVAREVADHNDAIAQHKDEVGHANKVLAALMLGLRATAKIGSETDWQGKSAAVRAGSQHLMDTSVAPYFAAALAEASGPGGTGQQQLDVLIAQRKKRDSMYSAANGILVKIFHSGIGVNDEGVNGERARKVVALFEKDGQYAGIYPAGALKVLKAGLPDEYWERQKAAEAAGKTRMRMRTPAEVQRAEQDKAEAAARRTAIKEATENVSPEFVADAIAAATLREVETVTSDNADTVLRAWFASLRIAVGTVQNLSHTFEAIESAEMTAATYAVGAKIMTDAVTSLTAIQREAAALADSARLLGGEYQNRHMKALAAKLDEPKELEEIPMPDSDNGAPDGAEMPQTEPEKPEAATVTPIKRHTTRKPRTPASK